MTAPGSNADFVSRFFAPKLGVLSMVARRIADDLKNRHPERPAQFNIAEGLTAYCDAGLLTVAMENMLSNA